MSELFSVEAKETVRCEAMIPNEEEVGKEIECPIEAVATVHWPDEDTVRCEEHCRRLQALANRMDWAQEAPLKFTSLATNQPVDFPTESVPGPQPTSN